MIKRLATKNGIAGILYRTRLPKFGLSKPTENAKKRPEEHTEEQDVMPEHQEEQIVYAHFQDQVKGDDQGRKFSLPDMIIPGL